MRDLTNEEKRILKSYERGDWKPVRNMRSEIKRYRKIARAGLRKDRRVNIRLPAIDLEGMRRRAFEEGIPYQTLIASVIHKYVIGRLIDRAA
ncbi:MAG: antitoxin [Elusimicrobia bacterium RIFCSPLOWO2_01_FULL_64_13]|nr:MAG: antitoxin [Elusimicrobia bacterium RIFCSPHIGHO2_01_FULL_64_10]OGR96370.1 MAG: antitoxin [Elusimicrobia bacterium RIFCSPLOWO2_01_FULL_64_13]